MTRRGRRDETGFTLIEIAITMLLLSLVLSMLFQALLSVQTAVDRQVGRSTRNDRLRLALHAIERQVRSGNVFSDPASENDPANGIVPGMSVRVYTQADASSPSDFRCIQYRIHQQRLESRSWSPQWAVNGQFTAWRVLAEGVRNRDASPQVPAFALSSGVSYGQRLLSVRLVAEGDTTERATQEIRSAITGRNTGFGFPASICSTSAPPYP